MQEGMMAGIARVLLFLAFVCGTNALLAEQEISELAISGVSEEAIVEENESNVTSAPTELEPMSIPNNQLNNRRYVFHSTPLPWVDAVMTCWREGGDLALPRSPQEARHIANILQSYATDIGSYAMHDAVHIAIHDISQSGTWRTIYGLKLSEAGYDLWFEGGSGYCGAMFADGRYFKQPCSTLLAFICEYSKSSNVSENYNYTVIQGMGHYKLHEEPLTWPEAKRRCESEGASLVVPRSGREAGLLAGGFLWNASPRTRARGFFVGATDVTNEGRWMTVQGKFLDEVGFDTWQTNEPSGNRSENCAVLKDDGLYADHSCLSPLAFCCEKSVTPSATVFEGNRYRLYTEKLTWWEAVVSCHKQNMTLAVPSTPHDTEQLKMLLRKAMSKFTGISDHVHTGLHGMNERRLWTSLRGGDADGFYNNDYYDNRFDYRHRTGYTYNVYNNNERQPCSSLSLNDYYKISCAYSLPYACE